MNYILRH